MSFPQRVGPVTLTGSNALLFTANRPLILLSIVLSNTDSSARTVRINLVPSGLSLAQSNRIVPDITVLANDTQKVDLDLPMIAGDTLQGLASVASVVNFTASYGDEKKVLRGS